MHDPVHLCRKDGNPCWELPRPDDWFEAHIDEKEGGTRERLPGRCESIALRFRASRKPGVVVVATRSTHAPHAAGKTCDAYTILHRCKPVFAILGESARRMRPLGCAIPASPKLRVIVTGHPSNACVGPLFCTPRPTFSRSASMRDERNVQGYGSSPIFD